MSAEIAELLTQAGPYLTGALGAYGTAVLTRAEDAAADATANAGRRLLQRVWRRGDAAQRAELEAVVVDADEDPDAVASALRLHLRRALREDPELRRDLAELVAAQPTTTINITASGERSIAAHTIRTAITGDGHRTDS
ncbi:hypothetical protein EH183_39125 [Streptomyces sp. CB01881]|uniref:hypothetical protein n=1 Tax=Streptomyces sp. CB01881 TaxID=2078691 RepID=UPI0011DF4747|nr:hypothetical protein [Streptomyces sp. CB01881]TYC68331.1 hypothetical protein EH183_39125 [Streptomyces sp. CB01881]